MLSLVYILVMGIEIGECQEVAKLVGLKVFTSEMLAYQELGVSISKGLISVSNSLFWFNLNPYPHP